MTMTCRTPYLLLAFMGLALAAGQAPAGNVVPCNRCSAPQQAAMQGGPGPVLVADLQGKKLWAFDNGPDRPSGRRLSTPAQVPPGVSDAYFRLTRIQTPAGANIRIRQDGRGDVPGMFPDGFSDANAALVAGDVNLQYALGTALAKNYAGANLDSVPLNDLAFELASIGLDAMGAAIGFDGANITLVWHDGGTTRMEIGGDDITQAAYIPGASVDADGNLLPDASIVRNGERYVGSYVFRDAATARDWVDTAIQYGITVGGVRSDRIKCTWDGRTLICRYQ